MRQRRSDVTAATRAKLIAAEHRVFASKHYADTELEDLTADAGFTGDARYHHFGSTKGLLKAVTSQIDAEALERLRAVLENAPALEGASSLRALVG